jgi:hypothetical protein
VPEPFANAMGIGDCYSVAAPLAYDRSPNARKKTGKSDGDGTSTTIGL